MVHAADRPHLLLSRLWPPLADGCRKTTNDGFTTEELGGVLLRTILSCKSVDIGVKGLGKFPQANPFAFIGSSVTTETKEDLAW